MITWSDAATALLGRWPGYVAQWGREAIAAYIAELEASGMTADQALGALRGWAGEAPPSVPQLVAVLREDPDRPTFEDAYRLIYGPGGIFRARPKPATYDNEIQMIAARRQAAAERALELDPWVGAFVHRYGVDRLAELQVNDDEYGALRRRELKEAWEEFVTTTDRRDLAQLTTGRRAGLGRINPLDVVPDLRRPSTEPRRLPATEPPASDPASPRDRARAGI